MDDKFAVSSHGDIERRHRSVGGGGARAAVFGISDGLVTNISLVLGIAAAHTSIGVVQLAGIAGLLGGSFSMAAGEYASMKAQGELLERELEVERLEIERYPDAELRELASIYVERGVNENLAHQLATQIMEDPERALEAHAREELGIDPSDLGSPTEAAVASFFSFAIGAVIPLAPYFFARGTEALYFAVAGTVLAAFIVGCIISLFTGRSWWRSALRQIAICGVAGCVTFAIGSIVGVAGVA